MASIDDTGPQIQQWQQGVLVHQENTTEKPPVALFFDACSEFFSLLLDALSSQGVTKSLVNKLERSYSQFLLWDNGYGVSNGEFEVTLKKSQRIGDFTLRTLRSICRTLTKKLLAVVDTCGERDTNRSLKAADVSILAEKLSVLVQGDDSSDESSSDELIESHEPAKTEFLSDEAKSRYLSHIATDLKTDIECLLDLGTRLEEQVINPIVNEEAADPRALEGWDPADYFVERIQRIFPVCDKLLSKRLGRANWERVLKFQKARDLNDVELVGDAEAEEEKSIAPVKPQHEETHSVSRFRDSGIGTTVRSRSVRCDAKYAKTLLTQLESDEGSLRFPTLADVTVQGTSFECIACGKGLDITEEGAWRAHLVSDLQPYICLESDCDSLIFFTKSKWTDHLVHAHDSLDQWESFTCRFCDAQTQQGKDSVLDHLSKHLEEISLMSLPAYQKPAPKAVHTEISSGSSLPSQTQSSPCCEICGFRPKGDPKWFSGSMAKHMKLQHGSRPPKIYKCPFPGCTSQFKNRPDNLYQHQIQKRHFVEGTSPRRPLRKSNLAADPVLERNSGTKAWATPTESVSAAHKNRPGNEPNPVVPKDWTPQVPPEFLSSSAPSSAGLAFASVSDESCHLDESDFPNFSETDFPQHQDTGTWYPLFPSEEDSLLHLSSTSLDTAPSRIGLSEGSGHGAKPLPPIIVEDPSDVTAMKRARNTLEARKSRERKAQRFFDLEERINKLEKERDHWKNIALTQPEEEANPGGKVEKQP